MRVPLALTIAAAALAGPLAGCVSWTPDPPAVDLAARPDAAETLVPELRLVAAAERAERALASLARTVPAPDRGTPWYAVSRIPRLDRLPEALRRPITLDWTGPVETLAAELARRAGYRFAQAGRPPARPPIVAVEADGEPLIAVLRDVGVRAGGAAMLTVDAARQTVLLDWAAPFRPHGETPVPETPVPGTLLPGTLVPGTLVPGDG